MTTDNFYRTKDLAEASFLIVKGRKLLELRWDGPICHFVLEDAKTCGALTNDYWLGQAEVPAKVFYDTMSALKRRLFKKDN